MPHAQSVGHVKRCQIVVRTCHNKRGASHPAIQNLHRGSRKDQKGAKVPAPWGGISDRGHIAKG